MIPMPQGSRAVQVAMFNSATIATVKVRLWDQGAVTWEGVVEMWQSLQQHTLVEGGGSEWEDVTGSSC